MHVSTAQPLQGVQLRANQQCLCWQPLSQALPSRKCSGHKGIFPSSVYMRSFLSLSGAEGKFKRHPDTYWEKQFWWGENGPLCSIQITGKMSTEQASPMGKEKQASFRLNYRKQNMSLNYLNPPSSPLYEAQTHRQNKRCSQFFLGWVRNLMKQFVCFANKP